MFWHQTIDINCMTQTDSFSFNIINTFEIKIRIREYLTTIFSTRSQEENHVWRCIIKVFKTRRFSFRKYGFHNLYFVGEALVASLYLSLFSGDHEGRPYSLFLVGEGLVPSRLTFGRPQGSPLRFLYKYISNSLQTKFLHSENPLRASEH